MFLPKYRDSKNSVASFNKATTEFLQQDGLESVSHLFKIIFDADKYRGLDDGIKTPTSFLPKQPFDHSLNVAEEAVHPLSASKAWHVIPDTMIAALAHDLGKLESLRGYHYSLGEHPLAAGRPPAGIPEFEKLPKKDLIHK